MLSLGEDVIPSAHAVHDSTPVDLTPDVDWSSEHPLHTTFVEVSAHVPTGHDRHRVDLIASPFEEREPGPHLEHPKGSSPSSRAFPPGQSSQP